VFFFFVFIFRNLLWGSVNYGQSLHGLHNTKSLRTPALKRLKKPWYSVYSLGGDPCNLGKCSF